MNCSTLICLLNWWGLRLFSDVWSGNAQLFERLMEIHSILYYGWKVCTNSRDISEHEQNGGKGDPTPHKNWKIFLTNLWWDLRWWVGGWASWGASWGCRRGNQSWGWHHLMGWQPADPSPGRCPPGRTPWWKTAAGCLWTRPSSCPARSSASAAMCTRASRSPLPSHQRLPSCLNECELRWWSSKSLSRSWVSLRQMVKWQVSIKVLVTCK